MSATRYDLGPVPSTSLKSISVSSNLLHHGFHMVVSQDFSSRILYAAFIPTSLHKFCLVKPPQPFRFHHSDNTVPSVMLCFVTGKTVPHVPKYCTSTSISRVKVFQEALLRLRDHEDRLTQWHNITSQKTRIFNSTNVKVSNITILSTIHISYWMMTATLPHKNISADHSVISSWPVTCFVSNGHSPLFSEVPLHYL
jgi:hypothetical protein